MLKRLASSWIAIGVALGLVVGSASGQSITEKDGEITVTFDEANGTELASFIASYQQMTGKVIHYDAKDIKDVSIFQLGSKKLPKNRFDIYFGSVLRNLDFIIVQFGPEDAGFLALRKLGGGAQARGQQTLKAQAQIVLPSELKNLADNPGLLVTTSLTTHYLPAREAVSVLNLYFAETSAESVRNIEGTETILMTGFANNVQGIVRLITEIDREPDDSFPQVQKRKLNHAVADEIQPVLKELVDAYMGNMKSGGGGGGGGGQGGGARRGANANPSLEPEPTIVPDAHSNTLWVTAGPKTMPKVLAWIDQLDVEVDPRGDTHVYRLRNSKSETLAQVLEEVVQADNRGATGRSSRGSTPGRGGGGGPSGGGSLNNGTSPSTTGEQPVVIVPDKDTNSLVITASKTRYAQILEIVKKLDVRPSQVLIQAALIEITDSLSELIGVELAGVNVNASSKTPFGITSFGITDLVDTNGDGFPDSRTLHQTNNQLAKGITGGIFDPKDFSLPFVLQMVATKSNSNILSLPSILTNDNESATVVAEDQVPFTQSNQSNVTTSSTYGGDKKAGITLKISPTISAGDYLRLNINLTVSAFSGTATDPSVPPPVLNRQIQTSVTLPDGHTVIFGGVITDDQRRQEDKVPILGDLPLIGFLFRNSNDNNKKTNLYFFLTPHIIADDFATLDDLTQKHKSEAQKLGGKVEMLNRFFDTSDANAQKVGDVLLEKYFEMPAYASVADRPAVPPEGPVHGAEH